MGSRSRVSSLIEATCSSKIVIEWYFQTSIDEPSKRRVLSSFAHAISSSKCVVFGLQKIMYERTLTRSSRLRPWTCQDWATTLKCHETQI
jgi:hypothetical protein